MEIDREKVFVLIEKKQWNTLLSILKDNKVFQELSEDMVFMNVFNKYFIDEILSDNANGGNKDKLLEMSAIYNFHKSKDYNFKLTEANFKKLILLLVDETKNVHYAKEFPEEEKCKNLLQKFNSDINQKSKSFQEDYELDQKFNLNEIIEQSEESFVISIFKSPQELEFYFAAQKVFPNEILLPNAALSTVINNNVYSGPQA